MANVAFRGAPSPRWRDALPPALGLAAAFAFALAAVLAEALLTLGTAKPGILLDWLAPAAALVTFLFALRATGPLREGALVASLAMLALFAALDPSPAAWTYATGALASIFTLGLRLQPATRLVASLPALAGLLMALGQLPTGPAATALAIAAVGGFLLALCFLVPHASGWRRVPFSAALAASLVVPVAIAGLLAFSLATDGLSRPDGDAASAAGPGFAVLAAGALALAAPLAVALLWRSPRAQEFQLPCLPLPGATRAPLPAAHDAPENA